MKKLIFTICILYSIYLNAQEFEPPVIIDPPNPMVGDTIRVGLFHTFYPPCLALPANNFQGLSHIFEFNGNDIRLTAVNDTFIIPICNPFPVSPAPRAWYELGLLPEGAYTLETWIGDSTLPLPIPEQYHPLVYGPILSFEVNAPVSINVMSLNWTLLFIFLILTVAYSSKLRKTY